MIFVFQKGDKKSSVGKVKEEKEKKSLFESSDKVISETDEELNEQDKEVQTTEVEENLTAEEKKKRDEMVARMKAKMDNENNYVDKSSAIVNKPADQITKEVKIDNQTHDNKSHVQSSEISNGGPIIARMEHKGSRWQLESS